MSKIIVIEGNIGAGKSTLLDLLKTTNKKIKIFKENVNDWNPFFKLSGTNKKYYKLLQQKILTHYLNIKLDIKLLSIEQHYDYFIIERSAYSAIHIFTELAILNGWIKRNECKELYSLYNLSKLDAATFIHVNTSPIICHKRILMRNRQFEKNISIQYLNNINMQYEKIDYKYVINGNKTPKEILNCLLILLNKM